MVIISGMRMNFSKERLSGSNSVDFLTICDESREHIEPRKLVWDVEKSIWMLKHRKKEPNLTVKREQYPETQEESPGNF